MKETRKTLINFGVHRLRIGLSMDEGESLQGYVVHESQVVANFFGHCRGKNMRATIYITPNFPINDIGTIAYAIMLNVAEEVRQTKREIERVDVDIHYSYELEDEA